MDLIFRSCLLLDQTIDSFHVHPSAGKSRPLPAARHSCVKSNPHRPFPGPKYLPVSLNIPEKSAGSPPLIKHGLERPLVLIFFPKKGASYGPRSGPTIGAPHENQCCHLTHAMHHQGVLFLYLPCCHGICQALRPLSFTVGEELGALGGVLGKGCLVGVFLVSLW